ncbi:PNP1/purine nucleoside phosphorylase I [Blumeria hordei DH14]|uniref:purine-nucleoside phosphorylase n=1 Tax=Blumeria graminis f. sp. hordei (strain DH14) TaxID=546991 RepID=N1JBD4_BLUG1|nr:PNP1/purine nucleoside phosphorylase I [Blumeria hordei DH14]
MNNYANPALDQIISTTTFLKERLPSPLKPILGIIGGSVTGQAPGARIEIGFKEIPGFPVSTVTGHAGKLIFGWIVLRNKSIPTVLMSGRAHFYEGYDLKVATFPIRVLGAMGVKSLIITNAAGALNPSYNVGDIMVMNDHVSIPSLSGVGNPLRGPLDAPETAGPGIGGPRFLALSDAYDLDLRVATWKAWQVVLSMVHEETDRRCDTSSNKANLHEGVYAFVGGPSYETRAEGRLLRLLGADVVGMSTVPEVIVARHVGMTVLGLSVVTNKVIVDKTPTGSDILNEHKSGVSKMTTEKTNHEEVLEAGKHAAVLIKRLIGNLIEQSELEIRQCC